MNEAGRSVGPARGAFRVEDLARVLVLHDEIDLPFGDIRSRVGGGPGRPQRPQVAAPRARRPGLRPRPHRRRAPRLDRPGHRRRPRARQVEAAHRRGSRPGLPRRRRGRARRARRLARRPTLDGHPGRARCPVVLRALTMLRTLLQHLDDDPQATTLQREGGRAFVSQSLRPYLVAALADARGGADARRRRRRPPGARPRGATCGRGCAPRPVRFYPSRGVTYESHLVPPPHLVGLRIAALDALHRTRAADAEAAGGRRVGRRAQREGPRPRAAPARLPGRQGRPARPRGDRAAAGRDGLRARRPGRGPRAVRHPRRAARPLPGHRRPRRPRRPVRHRGRDAARVLDLHPAQLRRARRGRDRAGRRARPPSTASWPSSPRPTSEERPDIAELLPVDRFRDFLDLDAGGRRVIVAADEELEPALRDHWQDVCAAFHDQDAHDLYVKPDDVLGALAERAKVRLQQRLRRPAARVPRPERRHRRAQPEGGRDRAREAHPLRLPHDGHVVEPRRGRARRLQPQPRQGVAGTAGRSRSSSRRRRSATASSPRASSSPSCPTTACCAAAAPSAPAAWTPGAQAPRRAAVLRRPADRRHRRPRGPRPRPLRRLRHEDRRRRHPRLPEPRVRRHGQGLHARRPAGEDQPLRRRGRRAPAAVQARRQELGDDEGARPPRRAGAGRRAAQPLRRAPRRTRPQLPRGLRVAARVRGHVPLPGDRRPARGDRARQGRHGVRAADGPPHLRRRRLRQDRGRAARRVQGGRGRQAGARARPDDDPRPAALRHVLRAPQGLPADDRARQPLPQRQGAEGRDQGASPTAGSTSSSARTGCSAATCAPRTSA